MMIRFSLEYGGWPVWSIDSGDCDVRFPADIEVPKELNDLLDEIQSEYDELFVDNEKEFYYKGFDNEAKKEVFKQKCYMALAQVIILNDGRYHFENFLSADLRNL